MPGSLLRALAVAAFYLALALFALRVVVPAPASTMALPVDLPPAWLKLSANDQNLTFALIASNARAFLRAPWTLLDGPQCFPLRHAKSLGEHALGAGLLGVVPYVLSGGDPLLTYNGVLVMTTMLAGVLMYVVVRAWTGSTAAALVAGTLFAMHPARLTDVAHVYVVDNYWTALALLAAARLFARRTWPAAVALAACIVLQTLESIYPLLALTVIGGTIGVWLLVRHTSALPALLPKLALVAVLVGTVAVVVLGPYLHMRAVWGSFGGHTTMLLTVDRLAPGDIMYVGTVLLVLAVVGVLDRMRGPRPSELGDPRLALVVAALLLTWAALASVPIPGLAQPLPSLFTLAGRLLPAFAALRGGFVLAEGNVLIGAVLAGFGVAALLRGRPVPLQVLVVVVVLAAGLAEVFVPALARRSYGRTAVLAARLVRPPAGLIELYGSPADGAVLDVPSGFTPGWFGTMSDYLALAAYHHRPIATCYNSFHVALNDEIADRGAHILRDPQAADALAALGIREVVLHQLVTGTRTMLAPPVPPAHLREVGRVFGRVRYALVSTAAVERSFAPLAAGAAADAPVVSVKAGAATVDVRVTNGSTATYRQPDPLEPPLLLARWESPAGRDEQRIRQYLAASLAAGESVVRPAAIAVPARPGRYRLTLAPAEQPELVISAETVEVTP